MICPFFLCFFIITICFLTLSNWTRFYGWKISVACIVSSLSTQSALCGLYLRWAGTTSPFTFLLPPVPGFHVFFHILSSSCYVLVPCLSASGTKVRVCNRSGRFFTVRHPLTSGLSHLQQDSLCLLQVPVLQLYIKNKQNMAFQKCPVLYYPLPLHLPCGHITEQTALLFLDSLVLHSMLFIEQLQLLSNSC